MNLKKLSSTGFFSVPGLLGFLNLVLLVIILYFIVDANGQSNHGLMALSQDRQSKEVKANEKENTEEADNGQILSEEQTELWAQEDQKIIPILCYHNFANNANSIYNISPKRFEEQMQYLKDNGYTVIPLGYLLRDPTKNLPDKPVVITIDDGFRTVYTNAYPILKKYNFPASLFIYTEYIGSSGALTWSHLKEMAEYNVEAHSHTISHPNIAKLRNKLAPKEFRRKILHEFSRSKEIIKKNTGQPVDMLSYPYGMYDEDMERLALEAGYKGMVTTNREPNVVGNINKLRLSRYTIYQEDTMDVFREKLEAQRLNVISLNPPDGSAIESTSPTIKAVIRDNINTDPNLIKVLRIEREVNFEIEESDKSITITVPLNGSLRHNSYIYTILAQDKATGKPKTVSWTFTIVPARYKKTAENIGDITKESTSSGM